MDIKNELKISRVNHPQFGECIKLNMPFKTILDTLSPDDENFYQNLHAHGIEDFDCPVMASPQDVVDFLELNKFDYDAWENASDEFKEIEKKKSKRTNAILNQLGNLLYQDVEFTDEITGKKGLRDQFGNIIVPALFDSCRGASEMFDIEYYAVVEKDGKFSRTPRDGSGKLIDDEGYDNIYLNGEALIGDKHGKVSVISPKVLIPCEMDWIAYDNFAAYGIIFGKDGKLGMRDSYLHKYIPPEYSAYDISTLRFCRNGEWGWVSRETDEFFTEPIGGRYDVMIPACDADSYLDYSEKPVSESDNQYFTVEEAIKKTKECFSEFKKGFKVKLKSLLELPPLKFAKGFKASVNLVNAIRSLSTNNKHILISCGSNKAPSIHITFSKKEGRRTYRLEWCPKSNAFAWYDARLKELVAFHQLILPGKDTFSLKFYRDFSGREVHTMAKFIEYYYATIWNVPANELIIKTAIEE